MAGLRKAKKYDWKDSNMALFGSDTEKQVKKESANHELAWRNAGQTPGVQVWRINKFKVTTWPKEDYGSFFSGDSYIVLNTYKQQGGDKLLYDVHFWIGKYSTQDEYGTAAYKTVELDTYLDGVPVQHREVQNVESDLFKSYFKAITLMEGGAESGFRSARQEKPIKRLFHFHRDNKGSGVVVKEIVAKRSNLLSSDVFILDLGQDIYIWNGKECNKDEKFKALMYAQELKGKRNGRPVVHPLDEGTVPENHKFFTSLDDDGTDDDDDIDQTWVAAKARKTLFRLSNESGQLECKLVSDGNVHLSDFKSEDVFIFDTQKEVFVWIGNGANEEEKKNGMPYAHNYLMGTDHPIVPITVLKEGQPSQAFTVALNA